MATYINTVVQVLTFFNMADSDIYFQNLLLAQERR